MTSVASIYALISVTLRGDIIIIPAWHYDSEIYPFDLHLILPKFVFASKNTPFPFLKFLNLVSFHYKGKLLISSYILVDTDAILDELHKIYVRKWNEKGNISEIPERRRQVELEIIKWSANLPKTALGQFIHRYYSTSLSETDWETKKALWRSLRQDPKPTEKLSPKKLEKLREKYLEIWFEHFDKINFSATINSEFPEFIESVDKLTFKAITPDAKFKICPVCETDLSSYPANIQFCAQCGYSFFKPEQTYCAQCGYPLMQGTSFCGNCGRKMV